MTTSKMYILRKIQKLRNMTISNYTTASHNFAMKIEIGPVPRMVLPILKTRNVNDDAF